MLNRHTLVHGVRRTLAPVTRTALFRRTAPWWLPPVERVFDRLTRGRLQVSGILVPSLVLHTTGAKSGEPRDVVLMFTPDHHGDAIIAGTSFARERHPAWTYNLLAHPEAEVSVRGRRYGVRAILVPNDQRNAIWQLLEDQWPGYRAYEQQSGRTVRLFRLTSTDDRVHHRGLDKPVHPHDIEMNSREATRPR